MKLFLREHIVLIIVQLLQFALFIGVFWLSGFRDIRVALYSAFLGVFFLCCYLIYYFFSRRNFYNRLSSTLSTLDDSLVELEEAPISMALQQLLKTQYNRCQKEMEDLSNKQNEHMVFIDRWIHQMKTPLSVLELSSKELDEPEASSLLEEIDRMKTGLHTVLYMSRLRIIEQDFQIKKVALNKLVREVSKENKRLFIRNQVYPQLNMEQEDILVETDEKWLFFMISQLVHNAVKYSTKKSNKMIISVYKRSAQAVFEITDFGVGIPKEDINRIYDAFYTGENGRIFRESTGVGLYLVKEVARYLGHQLEVKSKVGKGSTFRIIFSK